MKDSQLDLNFLNEEKYFNFQFEDWYGANIGLKGKGRKFVLENLLRIHNEWDVQLQKLNYEYYLAVWLYDPRLELSEIVCCIDSKIDYYENEVFLESKKTKNFVPDNFRPFEHQLADLSWTRKVDLEATFEWEIEWPKEQYGSNKDYFTHQRFYKKLKENSYRVIENEDGKVYFRLMGDVWIGKK
ncbi:hypothetical protein BD809_105252 [Aquimarina intermedia]|uniref:Uncharacterized protein n=2 Tax=Aquimarina intermedia TaxID=350814 RepID=A0A5S5C2M2_9FLAO|nr:hypothetical protein BD809_105252 [Aquimarina intermedia]